MEKMFKDKKIYEKIYEKNINLINFFEIKMMDDII